MKKAIVLLKLNREIIEQNRYLKPETKTREIREIDEALGLLTDSQKSSGLPSIISESEANGVCQHVYRDWRCDEEFQVCDKCKVVKFN